MGGRVPASKKASDGDPHPGPPWGPCPFSAAEMLPPSPLVEAAVGRLSATTAAKSSSLSALAEAGSRGPARPPWAAGGGTPAEQKGAALPGAEQPRLPQTWSARPAPPRHPQNPQPRRESPDPALGACRRPRLCGTERGPEASVPAGICPCSPRSAGGGRDAMCPVPARAEMERALGEPWGDGSSEMLDFIHRVQENRRDTAQGAGDKCFAAVWSKDCEGKVWLVLP